jgi:hypothetical protein
MDILKRIGRYFLILVAVTFVAQVPVGGRSIENHYHNFVNSNGFQHWYWTFVSPITWAGKKVVGSVKSLGGHSASVAGSSMGSVIERARELPPQIESQELPSAEAAR